MWRLGAPIGVGKAAMEAAARAQERSARTENLARDLAATYNVSLEEARRRVVSALGIERRARGLAEYVAPAERLVEDLATTLVRDDPALD